MEAGNVEPIRPSTESQRRAIASCAVSGWDDLAIKLMNTAQNPRQPSRSRIAAALLVAMAADAIPLMLGPVGWTFVDEIVDVVAMILVSLLIGFHPLLLPTFVIEFIPVADMLPTWTGCVAAVVLLKRKKMSPEQSSGKPPAIDI